MASRWLAARDAARVEGPKRTEEDINTILECVRDVKFVAKMDADDLRRLCGCMRLEEFGAHETIIQYGDRGDKYYIIIVGSVSVSVPATTAPCPSGLHEDPKKCDCLGRPFEVLVTLQKGMGFGELALQNDDKRSATVITAEPTVLLVVQRADYMIHAGQTHKRFIEDRVRFLLHFPKISQALDDNLVTMKDMHAMANLLHEHSLKGNEVLVEQGDVVDNLIFVKSGSLSLLRTIDVNAAKQAIRRGGESRPQEMSASIGAATASEEQTPQELGHKLAQAMLQMRRKERQQKALALEENGRRLSASMSPPTSPTGANDKERPSLVGLLQRSPTFGESGGVIGSMLQTPTTTAGRQLRQQQQQQQQQQQGANRKEVSLLSLLQATDLKHEQERLRREEQANAANSRSPSRSSKSKPTTTTTTTTKGGPPCIAAGTGTGTGPSPAPPTQERTTGAQRPSLGGTTMASTPSAKAKAKSSTGGTTQPAEPTAAARKDDSTASPPFRRKAPQPIDDGSVGINNNNNNDGNKANGQHRPSLGAAKGGASNNTRKRGAAKRKGQSAEKEAPPTLGEHSKWRKLQSAVSTATNIKAVADAASLDRSRRRMSSQSDAVRAAIRWNEAKGKANVDHFMDVAKARTVAMEFEYQRSVEERHAFRSLENHHIERSKVSAKGQKSRTLLRIGTLGPCQYFGDEQICNSCIYPYTLVSDPVADVYMMSKHDIVRRLPKKLFTFLFGYQKESVPSDAQFMQLHRQNARWCNFRRGTREGESTVVRKGQMETCPVLCRREGKPRVDVEANLDFLGLKHPEWEGPELTNPFRVKPNRPPLTQRDAEELSGTTAVFLRHFEFNKNDKRLDVEYRRNGQRQWRTGGHPPKKFDPSNDANTCIFEKNWNRCGIVPALDLGDVIDEAFFCNSSSSSKEAPGRLPSNQQDAGGGGGGKPSEVEVRSLVPRPSSVASGAMAKGRISRKSTNAPDRAGLVTPTPSMDASVRGSLVTPQPIEGGRVVHSSLSSRFSPSPTMLVRETPMSLTGLPDLSTPSLPPTPVPLPTRPSTSMAPRRMQVAWEGKSEQ